VSYACIVLIASGDNIGRAFVKCFNEIRKSKVHGVFTFIVTNDGIRKVIPQLRPIILNNISHGVSIYLVNHNEFNRLVSEINVLFKQSVITSFYIYSDDINNGYVRKLIDLAERIGLKYKVVTK